MNFNILMVSKEQIIEENISKITVQTCFPRITFPVDISFITLELWEIHAYIMQISWHFGI